MTSKQKKAEKAAQEWAKRDQVSTPAHLNEPAGKIGLGQGEENLGRMADAMNRGPLPGFRCIRCTMDHATAPDTVCQHCRRCEPDVNPWAECNRCTLEGKPARLIVHGELATVEPEDLDLENLYTSRAAAYDVFELYDGDFDRERDEEPDR